MKQQIRRILALALVVLALAAIFTGCAKKPGKTLTVDVTATAPRRPSPSRPTRRTSARRWSRTRRSA